MNDEDVDDIIVAKKSPKRQVKAQIDDPILKKDHHHLNKLYSKGTKLSELNADEGSVAVMKDRGII